MKVTKEHKERFDKLVQAVKWDEVDRAVTLRCQDGKVPTTALTGGGASKVGLLNAICILNNVYSGETRSTCYNAVFNMLVAHGAERIKDEGHVTQTSLRRQIKTVKSDKYKVIAKDLANIAYAFTEAVKA